MDASDNVDLAEAGMPVVSRLPLVALRERVYAEIGNALRSGRFAPASTLTIRGLAASLGTSTTPVREEVASLVRTGFRYF
ncbi:GntR family transcriptional regulator [Burkholderia pyrrocinia]|uniref:GntR family transcriptional regulator n=1 Tax=Burkholderia pyrrocinia TaxID=60550 RepID=UPI001FC84785|nr:GntR family transcriptional regulator [Burkholderia pyrrocinia]